MSGYSVMVGRPGRRARRIYPTRLRVLDGQLQCGGITSTGKDSLGYSASPCEFLERADAEWFAALAASLYRDTGRTRTVTVQSRNIHRET